jgi:hypothetical protein
LREWVGARQAERGTKNTDVDRALIDLALIPVEPAEKIIKLRID